MYPLISRSNHHYLALTMINRMNLQLQWPEIDKINWPLYTIGWTIIQEKRAKTNTKTKQMVKTTSKKNHV
ncbi:hypothetical protein DERP_004320 [Dermatophagoides pteronyssinus]|uniref:Uncharacterized protein n=1 Tax=Dermatophagoides pteronyssinus TaxID=6956 RepID=A0ABQ8JNF7_DERPT|nr:hypothetical protein DERP_004320 [Dermatophagoides pteronyssinus]